jgi:uncharacterized protein YegJ (DUF2314 family)
MRGPALFIALSAAAAFAQRPSKAPQDKPVSADSREAISKFERAIAPYVAEARKTWPAAKKKYLAGAPHGETFYVTLRLKDGDTFEQSFVRVTEIKDGKISGTVASELLTIHNFKRGDTVVVKETEIYDWMFAKPDGSEEGNVVGKFLDTYQP